MDKIFRKWFCAGVLVLSMQELFAMEKTDIGKWGDCIKSLQQLKANYEEKLSDLRWASDSQKEKEIIIYQEQIQNLSKARESIVAGAYQCSIPMLISKAVIKEGESNAFDTDQQEALVMFASQLNAEGNVEVNDPYFLYAAVNTLNVNTRDKNKDSVSSDLLSRILSKIPMEYLEGSEFYKKECK